jgi:hypothetical protein
MVEKTRVVIIAHPDFQGGTEGIKQAKDFAEHMIAGQKQMILAAERSGEPNAKIEQVRRHTKAFQIVIRNIDKDII